ncbi:MAG: carbon monoxide dehydrogenase [Deltaproteobacteria bacterium]|nr:MAG: carbon monoxide dehydrogenase [Deltaproteobacteria bacterium]
MVDRLGHWQMRWGFGRMRYRVRPGLYAVGEPQAASPVLVTANYKMTVDLLRRELAATNAWLLVLDTRGVNVWCAAGKGTFGTAEIIRQVTACRLAELVGHRTLVLPQLGAPGVAAHEVLKGCGFRVIYGPVRAADLPAFLAAGMQATPAMRRVTFTLGERLVLTPVELTAMWKSLGWGSLLLLLIGGIGPRFFTVEAALQRGPAAIAAGLAGVLAGAVVVPVLLPWLPGRMFAVKGAVAGLAVALAGTTLYGARLGGIDSAALLLALPAVAAWCAMNFTGATTFTSPSGVEREMRRTLPVQAAALLAAGTLWIAGAFLP